MGVWIEIWLSKSIDAVHSVTPLVGVWIEILINFFGNPLKILVTPLVGVWIEICINTDYVNYCMRHSPCGSVD